MAPENPTQPSPVSKGRGAERRRWTRAGADWPIMVQLAEGTFEAKVRDVSRAGVCFFLDRPIAAMTLLQLNMSLPVREGVRNVTGTGAVVRCEKISARLDHYEIAVFVQDMAEPDRSVIEEYVSLVQGELSEEA